MLVVLTRLCFVLTTRDRLKCSSINQGVIHSVINSLVTVDEHSKPKSQLALYKSVFESRFLKTTGEYYKQKASEYISELTCCQYLEKVQCSLRFSCIIIIIMLLCAVVFINYIGYSKRSIKNREFPANMQGK